MNLKKTASILITAITIAMTTIIAIAEAPKEPDFKKSEGIYYFGTFITSELSNENKKFMLNAIQSEEKIMSINYTEDAPLFSLATVPNNIAFINFENKIINGRQTIVANFDSEIPVITFKYSNDKYIFSQKESSNQILINYLLDASYFNGLDQLTVPPINYDWQKYIPAGIEDDDGLEQINKPSSNSSSNPDTQKEENITLPIKTISAIAWTCAGILIALLALIAIIKLVKKK